MNANVACVVDPQAAAMRDEMMRSGPPPSIAVPPLGRSARGRRGTPDSVAGQLAVQGRIARGEQQGLADAVLGGGFTLICRTVDPAEALGGERLAFLERIGGAVATLRPGSPHTVRDIDGRLTAWLEEHALEGVISRPDGYAFGGAREPAALPDLLDELRERLAYIDGDRRTLLSPAAAAHS